MYINSNIFFNSIEFTIIGIAVFITLVSVLFFLVMLVSIIFGSEMFVSLFLDNEDTDDEEVLY